MVFHLLRYKSIRGGHGSGTTGLGSGYGLEPNGFNFDFDSGSLTVPKSSIFRRFLPVLDRFWSVSDDSGWFQTELKQSVLTGTETAVSRFQNWWNRNRTGSDRFQFWFRPISVPTGFGSSSHRFGTDGSSSENRILATPT
ncbi:hypothetical protein JCGZ_17248 [Jatropha curcas]|uniref:Uncharacterized protein n=1 Tax=Jatropha curcas TaxID=180498 RepID=A0A067LAZ2_JATCU|nr:hypothetical protein JCGZ_17248 [Jatropha curcas]